MSGEIHDQYVEELEAENEKLSNLVSSQLEEIKRLHGLLDKINEISYSIHVVALG